MMREKDTQSSGKKPQHSKAKKKLPGGTTRFAGTKRKEYHKFDRFMVGADQWKKTGKALGGRSAKEKNQTSKTKKATTKATVGRCAKHWEDVLEKRKSNVRNHTNPQKPNGKKRTSTRGWGAK